MRKCAKRVPHPWNGEAQGWDARSINPPSGTASGEAPAVIRHVSLAQKRKEEKHAKRKEKAQASGVPPRPPRAPHAGPHSAGELLPAFNGLGFLPNGCACPSVLQQDPEPSSLRPKHRC